ncbi:hypothetical protein [Nitrosopumilus ureiphilus]|uniref:DUF3303 domain-containing protein n=1 Tax=Nitrosopumilus ureiphilus TaxID=1470067 RepID=A0A7D5R7N9_9ARCH|nr:hypothetical protein [Nitrosopumilus ureiphilus]QLH07298.1 hypothetical protein C5F50_09590 [Nitrosopumilus ureiphilus]
MSQQEAKPWVLVTNIKEKINPQDLEHVASQISTLIDEWQSQGKIMWSGPFDNEQSSMAVFEATEAEAKEFFKKYDDACSKVLTSHLYQWGAMPLLSVLSK